MKRDSILFLLTFWSMWFYNYSSRTIFSPILPSIETELGITHGQAGGIFTFVFIGYGLGLVLAGALLRWFSSRKLLMFGHVALILSLGLFSFGRSYGFLALICLLLGFGAGIYPPCVIPLLAERFSSDNWAKIMGLHGTGAPTGLLTVPLIAALLLKVASWRYLTLLFSLLGILLLPALIRFTKTPSASPPPLKPDYWSLFRDKRIWVLAILLGIASSANIGIYAIVPLFLVTERGFTLIGANQLLGISRVAGVVVPFIGGVLADRIGYIKTLISIMVLSGAFTVLMAVTHTETALAVSLLLQTSTIIGFFSVCLALVSRTARPSNRGAAVALTMVSGAVFMAATPWLLGTIADYSSFSYGIVAIGFMLLFSPLLLGVFR
jgi:NNP family nitrate/nitrite transporter-like MFS transporter